MPRAMPVQLVADSRAASSGPSSRTICALSQASSRASTLSRAGPVELLVGKHAQARLEQLVARLQLARPVAEPAHAPSLDSTSVVSAAAENRSARASISPASAFRGGVAQRLGLGAVGLRVGHELEAMQVADVLTLDGDVARGRDFRFHASRSLSGAA